VHFFKDAFNVTLQSSWTSAPLKFDIDTQTFERIPGTYFNVPAFLVIILLTTLLIIGIKESATVNAVVVGVKILVVVVFVIAASTKINPENYKPFVPPNEGEFTKFGGTGILSAATMVFFAYIGFDSVSTTAQEARNPQRTMPIGIIGSLIICTVLYISVW
jgi:basic amino acid/polyamine antiporter, APA family